MEIGGLESGWLRLQRQITRLTRRDDAEDLLHSSFLRMIEKKDRIVVNPEAFLLRSAINEARDGYRRAQHPAAPQTMDQVVLHVQDGAPLQDETLIARQRLDRIKQGLDQLTPRTREIFLMHRLDGLKYREIADVHGITMSAVEKHIAKAVQFLADWSAGW
jgi:RNA polymerase sigma factor (sigma-70 family)